jgi:hypothetical protein
MKSTINSIKVLNKVRTLRPHRLHEAIPKPSGRTTQCGGPIFRFFERFLPPTAREPIRAEGRCSLANLAAVPRSLARFIAPN